MATPSPRPDLGIQLSAAVDVAALKALFVEWVSSSLRTGARTPEQATEVFRRARGHLDHQAMYVINQLERAIQWNVEHEEARPDA